jgi:hypothetical protein
LEKGISTSGVGNSKIEVASYVMALIQEISKLSYSCQIIESLSEEGERDIEEKICCS